MRALHRQVANALLFQLGWFTCVFGASQPWLLLIAVACLAAHFYWLADGRDEAWRVAVVVVLGSTLDSLLLNLGLFDFPGDSRLLPAWLALLWALLAITLRHSLAWTAKPWWRASLLGALSAPLSYLGGAKLAGVGLPLGLWPSLLMLALLWALLLPLLHLIASRPRRPA